MAKCLANLRGRVNVHTFCHAVMNIMQCVYMYINTNSTEARDDVLTTVLFPCLHSR